MSSQWLDWLKQLQSLAQNGLTYAENPYEVERYEQLRDISSQMMAAISDAEPEFIANLFKHEKGYMTPKVDVRGVVFNDVGEMLLVQEAKNGRWTLPGGWADVGDTPRQAVEREIREESGYEAQVTKLLAVYDRDQQGYPAHEFAIYKLFFACDLVGGEAKLSHETTGVGFFSQDNLPDIDEGRSLTKHLLQFFAQRDNPYAPTLFD